MAKNSKIMSVVKSVTGLGKGEDEKRPVEKSEDAGQEIDGAGVKMVLPAGADLGWMTAQLFELYVARVGVVDLIHTARTDKRKMFAEALDEAKVALGVFREEYPAFCVDAFKVAPVAMDLGEVE